MDKMLDALGDPFVRAAMVASRRGGAMIAAVAEGYAELTRQREAILAKVGGLTGDELRFRARAGEWSTLEVLDHLVRVEEATVPTLRKHLVGNQAVSVREKLGAVGVIAVMRTPIRIKVPTGAADVMPTEPEGLEALTDRWETARGTLLDVLEGVELNQLEIGVFRHPVCGWMRVGDALEFLSAHLQHHGYQLRRLERERVKMSGETGG